MLADLQRWAFAVVSLTAVALVVTGQGQRPQVFRNGVTFVSVDAYPRRGGRLVEGLRAEDFQIFEDGKPQKIETFEFIRIEPNSPDADRRDPNTADDGDRLAADPRNRVFVVYLDRYHTTSSGAREARRPLLDFLSRTINATDLFGVMTPDTPAGQLAFGRRLETLEGELTKYADWGMRDRRISPLDGQPIEVQLETCLTGAAPSLGDALVALHREDVLTTSLHELMVRLRDLRDQRKNLLLISEGWNPTAPSALSSLAKGGIPRVGTEPGGRLGINPPEDGTRNQSWCDSQILRLAGIDFDGRFRDLLVQANRANVSFYPIDVGGLRVDNAPSRVREQPLMPPPLTEEERLAQRTLAELGTTRRDILMELADNTDGVAIVNTNDLNAGFRQIAAHLSAYYLLGYSSTNPTPDGKFRKIEVKVNQASVQVTARHGYLAPNVAPPPATSAVAAVPAVVTEALGRLSGLGADAGVFTYGIANKGALDIVTEISSRESGRWSKGADVRVAVSRDNTPAVIVSSRIEPMARAVVVNVPITATDAGPWHVNVRVSNPEGTLEDRLDVSAGAGVLLGAPLCYRGTASVRVALQPVADFQFRRTERLHVNWPVLKTLDEFTARVLDRRGQPLAVSATVSTREEVEPRLAVDLNLAPLGEGVYLIELWAGAAAESERRLLAFRVVR